MCSIKKHLEKEKHSNTDEYEAVEEVEQEVQERKDTESNENDRNNIAIEDLISESKNELVQKAMKMKIK